MPPRHPHERKFITQKNRISIAIATAAIVVSSSAFAAPTAPGFYHGTQHINLGKISVGGDPAAGASVAAAALGLGTAPGFYINTQHIPASKIQQTVRNYGAGAIHFVPPAASNGPVEVVTACGPFKYSFIHTPSPHSRAQIWRDNTGKAMSEKIINACQRGPLTIHFSPVIKK